jgi:hypothetical protein
MMNNAIIVIDCPRQWWIDEYELLPTINNISQ